MSKTLPRPPVVAILGHVDHGKTTLLDNIRKSRLAAKETGGITQRIGAYEIATGIKGYSTDRITFIDTPGHEAFSQLRARGANVADIAILVVDAKDSVMPQTVESISHIKSAKIPFIVAINKVDLPEANVNKVKNDLTQHEVFTEDKGGDVIALPISAKTGTGVKDLLEAILLLSSEKNLIYSPDNPLKAYILETKKGKQGIIATAIIKDGVIRLGDTVYVEENKIKVRSMVNDLGQRLTAFVPSQAFELLGFEYMPTVGVLISNEPGFAAVKKTVENKREIDMESFLKNEKEEKKLKLIVKADAQGSLDAIVAALEKKGNIDIVLKAVGGINKSDVFLAKTTKAVIVGFSVLLSNDIQELAKQEKVIIKTYNLIYELLEELEEVADILKEKEEKEKNYKGEAKALATFIIDKETIFGVKVTKGKVNLGDQIELFRNNLFAGKTKLVSLKVRAKTVNEVKKDQEAGMLFYPILDIKVGDVVKSIL